MTFLLPALSAHDPAASGEGSRDPLGLEGAAERLASIYLPAVTARMTRIRALTVLALGAHVCQPMHDEYTADESAPAWLTFEWIWAEATASGTSDARGIPGIDTTKRHLRNGERLSSRNYLKGATALGLHGFYRTLAESTGVLDADGHLDENGEQLLLAWEHDQGLCGLIEDRRGTGRDVVRFLRDGVHASLKASACAAPPTGQGILRLKRHLAPAFDGDCLQERKELRRLLEDNDRRGAVLELLEAPGVEAKDADPVAHATAATKEARLRITEPFPEVAAALDAFIAFERFGAAVSTAFDLVRHRSTKLMRRPTPLADLWDSRYDELAERLPQLISDCDSAFADVPPDRPRGEAINAFRGVSDASGLLDALLTRHESTQRGKGSGGKLTWFEPGPKPAVRAPYTVTRPPSSDDRFIHPTRLPNAAAFLSELR